MFIRETLMASYSHTGRPSLDPEVLLRILLIGYLYGITTTDPDAALSSKRGPSEFAYYDNYLIDNRS
jgi:hypothetical protein